jgi:hypothetical protein
MRFAYTLAMLAIPMLVAAEEVVAETAPAVVDAAPTPEVAGWVGMVQMALMVIIPLIFGGFLKKKWDSEKTKTAIDTSKSLMEQKNMIIDQRLMPFLVDTAEHWLLTQLPAILKDAGDGGGFQWKDHLMGLKTYAKDQALKKFAHENIDLIELLGADALDNLIDRQIMRLIGKLPEKVQAFIPAGAVDMLTDKASEYAIEKGKGLLKGIE